MNELPTASDAARQSHLSFDVRPSLGVDRASEAQMRMAMVAKTFNHEAGFFVGRAIPPGLLIPANLNETRTSTHPAAQVVVAEGLNCSLIVVTADQATRVSMWADEWSSLDRLWQAVSALANSLEDQSTTGDVQISTWSDGSPLARAAAVRADPWPAIRRNYSEPAARAIDALMAFEGSPPEGGRLILFHGEPGTGKTHAVTSLMKTWEPWCDIHLVTDPERFFTKADYLTAVLDKRSQLDHREPLPLVTQERRPRWKLIVCEDADEYIRSDARHRSGPALGRLLNATDGIVGQQSRALILLTTNDDLGRLHPALTRPGRCLAAVNFPAMTREEAAAWCPSGTTAPRGPVILAELYGHLRGNRPDEPAPDGLYL